MSRRAGQREFVLTLLRRCWDVKGICERMNSNECVSSPTKPMMTDCSRMQYLEREWDYGDHTIWWAKSPKRQQNKNKVTAKMWTVSCNWDQENRSVLIRDIYFIRLLKISIRFSTLILSPRETFERADRPIQTLGKSGRKKYILALQSAKNIMRHLPACYQRCAISKYIKVVRWKTSYAM